MGAYLLIGLFLSIYLSLAYLAGSLLGLHGSGLWILRGLLALLGIIAAVVYLMYSLKRVKQMTGSGKSRSGGKGGGGGGAVSGGEFQGEVKLLVKEARARLTSSELGSKAKLKKLPVIVLLGKSGSTKTSSMVHSGLEPELLAGQVYQDSAVIPTSVANLWYARQAVFVEAGGKLPSQRSAFKHLIKKLKPGGLLSLFRSGGDAPRAALVCISCEEFLKPGASESLSATARELRAYLEQLSQTLGVRLPVYVLFTKMDRIAFFAEYVRNLSAEEAGQVVGITLPADEADARGIYTERQSRKLTAAFNDLFYSLCNRRPDLLVREHDEEQKPGIYEFPRELRKLRPVLVQLLVDLCRPSQLRAGPFLRGFYFSGVRAIVTRDVPVQTTVPKRSVRTGSDEISGATMVFNADQALEAQRAAQTAQATVSRKKPQWVFLSHLFNDVLLGDKAAMGASGASVKTSLWRRILLATAAVLCLIWIIGMIVSFSGNRSLEAEVIEAARGIKATEATGGQLASVESLQKLEILRQALERLTRYEQDGPPMKLRWGLYTGSSLYPGVRRAYYTRFHQLLFASVQVSLIHELQRLPAKPAPTDEYGSVYDTLKAYLITTSHPDKSTRAFLSPVLMKHWVAGRGPSEELRKLAQLQFDFYADDLVHSNPFSSQEDSMAVGRGRRYLSQFAGLERVYQFMLAEASKQNSPVNFNRLFPGSAKVVVNNKEVLGAFTKGGWAFMQDAVKHADRFFGGERWVLGEQATAGIDPAQLEKQLAARYSADFIAQWADYLRVTSVVRYRNLGDAAQKLNAISGNQSPLLAALWLASQNTAVDSERIKQVFQPVQHVVPPESKDRYIGDSNTAYMNALVGLQAAVEQAANASGAMRDAAVGQVISQATQAKVVTRQVAQNFRIDPKANIGGAVQKLMEQPILYAEALVRSLGPAELNGKGRALCTQIRSLMGKYPFQPRSKTPATLPEVATIYQPATGALWAFYEQSLQEHLLRQGTRFVPNPSSKIKLNPAFVRFFNRAAAFSAAFYPSGSPQAKLSYNVTLYLPKGMKSLSLIVDNQMLTTGKSGSAKMGFTWPGSGAQQVRLVGRFGGKMDLTFASYQGLWSVFRFFGDADVSRTSGNVTHLEWVPRQGRAGQPMTLPDGTPLTVRFDVECAVPVFQKGYFAGLHCVPRVAR